MPKPENTGKPVSPGKSEAAKSKAPRGGGYTVTIDGVSQTVKSHGDVKELVLETLADGQAHSVEVDVVDVVKDEDDETPETPEEPVTPVE